MSLFIGVLIVGFLIFAWGMLWGVISVIAGKRWQRKKPLYVPVIVLVMAAELAAAIGLVALGERVGAGVLGGMIAPLMAAVAGGVAYAWIAEHLDRRKALPDGRISSG